MGRAAAHSSDTRIAEALRGRYELQELLGRGGFAEVWKAHELSLDRAVAIKVLRPEQAENPDVAERFLREARAMARIAHANIVQVYATGEYDGFAWMAMQFVAGESLRARLDREGALTADTARRILGDAATALGAAHSAGIIHRDVKPDNILIDSDGRALLTDFGIARAQLHASRTLTGTGLVVGTPHYMSPEQGSGDAHIDQRTDLYSLGVVGYQMLAGRLPFDADNPLTILMMHASEPPPPLARFRPDAPAELIDLVERCLRKRPDDRLASAEEFLHALTGNLRSSKPDTIAAPATASAVHVDRRIALGVGVALAAMIADPFIGAGGVMAIAGAAIGAFTFALAYGDRWRRSIPASTRPAGDSVQRVRSDRAAVLAMLTRVPRGERQALEPVRKALDDLVVRVAETERALEARPSRDEETNIQRAVRDRDMVRYRSASAELRRSVRHVWSDGIARAAPMVERALAGYAETVRRDT
jgi:tRNA A-37 threonylcarbamoyl transferase component Bud32